MRTIPVLLLAFSAAMAADLGAQLLDAAKKGQVQAVQSLVARGVNLESRDKQGRTALMLAAARGQAPIVKFLIEKGAKTDARDRDGWTASGLALVSGSRDRDTILGLLPAVPHGRISLDVTWSRENLYNSCSLAPPQLAEHVASLQPDGVVLAALRDVAALSEKRAIEFIGDPGGDAVLTVRVRPGASCLAQQSVDQLSLAIDAKLVRGSAVLLEKTFGGGLKGLHVRTVRSPAQYQPFYSEWAKSHAAQIYEAALEAWLRSTP
jgi:ankyrin repeat protein